MRIANVIALSIVLFLTIPRATILATPLSYNIIDLGEVTVTGGGALDINNSSQVVVNLAGTGYVWDAGSLTPSGGLPINNTSFAISDTGHTAWTFSARAQFWDGNTITVLPRLEDGLTSGWDINSNDHVVGTSRRSSIGRTRAYLWDGSSMLDLGSLTTDGSSGAFGINDDGVIVGDANEMPASWTNKVIEPLPLPADTTRGTARDISESGHIVGQTYGGRVSNRLATIWSAGSPTVIGTLPGLGGSDAYGVNDLGEAVGHAFASSTERAFLYSNGVIIDLNDLVSENGWILEQAYSINNSSEIVGVGEFNGDTHAFVLLPIPEPASMTLLSVSALVVLRRNLITKAG